MDIRSLFPVRASYSRSGGRSSVDLSDSIQGKENRLQRVRDQLNYDRETVTLDGPISPALQTYLDAPVKWRVVGQAELDELNSKKYST